MDKCALDKIVGIAECAFKTKTKCAIFYDPTTNDVRFNFTGNINSIDFSKPLPTSMVTLGENSPDGIDKIDCYFGDEQHCAGIDFDVNEDDSLENDSPSVTVVDDKDRGKVVRVRKYHNSVDGMRKKHIQIRKFLKEFAESGKDSVFPTKKEIQGQFQCEPFHRDTHDGRTTYSVYERERQKFYTRRSNGSLFDSK